TPAAVSSQIPTSSSPQASSSKGNQTCLLSSIFNIKLASDEIKIKSELKTETETSPNEHQSASNGHDGESTSQMNDNRSQPSEPPTDATPQQVNESELEAPAPAEEVKKEPKRPIFVVSKRSVLVGS